MFLSGLSLLTPPTPEGRLCLHAAATNTTIDLVFPGAESNWGPLTPAMRKAILQRAQKALFGCLGELWLAEMEELLEADGVTPSAAFFGGMSHMGSIVATARSKTAELSYEKFSKMLREEPSIASTLLIYMARNQVTKLPQQLANGPQPML